MTKSGLESFWTFTPEELYSQLSCSINGLSSTEVADRKKKSGKVARTEQPQWISESILFLKQFRSPLVLLLVAAVILSAFLGETADVIIIFTILLATGSLSFWQESRANKAVAELRAIISVKARVIRDGKEMQVPASDIIPGDMLILSAGDIVSADCLLVEANSVHVNEASLTGESYPASKSPGTLPADTPMSKRSCVLFQGTTIVSGSGKALAIKTGADTEFGKISEKIRVPATETAFEKGIRKFGFLLMQITIVLALLIFGINIYFGRPFLDSVLFALALTIGMAPELLPAIMTVAMSFGARKMAAQKVIVKKLSSIQNLGEVNILCSDKTGTLTEGIIQVFDVLDSSGVSSADAKKWAYLNALFETGFSNPMDDAIRGLKMESKGYEKLDEVPYDFIRKRLSISLKDPSGESWMVTKGAFASIVDICESVTGSTPASTAMADHRANLEKLFQEYSAKGFRTIGLSIRKLNPGSKITKDDEKGMTFAGIILLHDPPKPGISEVISSLKSRGVRLQMITGDNPLVAAYIAKLIGFTEPRVLSGHELLKMSPEALILRAPLTDIFAEIEPDQKERIVRAIQHSGNVVAYIGDGINDVAALHAADVGISTNNAVDVAKEAADVVLLEKNLEVVERGIVEGRKTFINTLKYIFINTSATFGNMFSVAGASLLLPFLPMLPKQILMTNFLTDAPYMTVASDQVDEDRLNVPQKWNNRFIRNFMFVFGIQSSIFDFLTFYILYYIFKQDPVHFRTGWFIESVLTELLILFIVRTRHGMLQSKPGKYLWWSSVVAFLFTILLPYTALATYLGLEPLQGVVMLAIAGILTGYVITAEIAKSFFYKSLSNK